MVEVNKQAVPRRVAPVGAPARQPVQEPVAEDGAVCGVKMSTFGPLKAGKTRFACTFPKPLLLMGTEDGTKSVCTGKRISRKVGDTQVWELLLAGRPLGVDFVRMVRSAQLDDCLVMLRSAGGGAPSYRTAVLDHGTGLRDIILAEVLGLDGVPQQGSWGMAGREEWGVVGVQWKDRMRHFFDLADHVGLNVVVLNHEQVFKVDDARSRIRPTLGPALGDSTAGWVNGRADYVCRMFCRAEEVPVKIEEGGVVLESTRRTGKYEYCLQVGQNDDVQVGFRHAPGVELPASGVIVDPTFAKLAKLISGEGLK